MAMCDDRLGRRVGVGHRGRFGRAGQEDGIRSARETWNSRFAAFRRCRRGDSRVRRESSSLASRAGTSSMSSEESLRAAFAAA